MREEVTGSTRISDPVVLNALIHRLSHVEPQAQAHAETVCVSDVAEALGKTPAEVARELESILRELARERVITALREIEEPLYRVERPGHGSTIEHQDPLMRIRTVQELTERATPHPEPTPVKLTPPTLADKWVGIVIAGAVVGAMVLLLVWALVAGLRGAG